MYPERIQRGKSGLQLANSLVYPERIHRGIEWTSVFETFFICLLANSLVYPERIQRGIEWTSVFETFFVVGKFSLFYTVQYGKVQYSTGIYTVQILTFADDSSLTLKATNFFLYDQFLPRYKPTVLECCNILNKDSHRRSRRNLFSVVGLSSVCVFSP